MKYWIKELCWTDCIVPYFVILGLVFLFGAHVHIIGRVVVCNIYLFSAGAYIVARLIYAKKERKRKFKELIGD